MLQLTHSKPASFVEDKVNFVIDAATHPYKMRPPASQQGTPSARPKLQPWVSSKATCAPRSSSMAHLAVQRCSGVTKGKGQPRIVKEQQLNTNSGMQNGRARKPLTLISATPKFLPKHTLGPYPKVSKCQYPCNFADLAPDASSDSFDFG